MIYKIHGKVVSKKEWDKHYEQKKAIFGDFREDILESRQAPGTKNTDRAFLQGITNGLTHGLDKVFIDRYHERARKAGINTTGKVYVSQLGRADSPLAWVSDLSDVKKSCEIQGHGCDALGVKTVVKDPGPDIPLADDIVQAEVEKRLSANPDLKAKVKEKPEKIHDLRGEIIDKHGARKR
jgi:hypothetical protein